MGEIALGQTFAGHRIDAVLARGGMGVVYRAHHLGLEREVALKTIAPELADQPGFRERFKRESKLAARIRHPNVIPIHDAGEWDGILYVTMDLIAGPDLRQVIHDSGPLGPLRAAEIVAQIASALDAAHALGLVHRDIKPANVLVESRARADHCYLTDFGLTKSRGSRTELTGTGKFVGTIDYMAPEQIRGGDLDARTDVYALGCVLYEAVTGNPPFRREDDVVTLYAHLEDDPPSLAAARPDAPAAFETVIRRALAKDPDQRFPSAGELGTAAIAAASATPAAGPDPAAETESGEATVVATPVATAPSGDTPATEALEQESPTAYGEPTAAGEPPTALERAAAPRRRSRMAPLLVAAAGIAVIVVGAVLVLGRGGGEAPPGGGAEPRPAGGPIEVGPEPRAVAGGPSGLFAGGGPPGTLARIDPETGERQGVPTDLDTMVAELAVTEDAVWVAGGTDEAVTRLDPETGTPEENPTPTDGPAAGVAIADDVVWVPNGEVGRITRLDAADGRPLGEPIELPGSKATAVDVEIVGDTAWVVNQGESTVVPIDRESLDIGAPIPVGNIAKGIVATPGYLWVTNQGDDTVSRVDPEEGTSEPVSVGAAPREIAAGLGYLWVANSVDGTVTRIDPRSGRVAGDPIRAGGRPFDVAVAGGSVWTADFGDDSVVRIDP